MRSKQELAAAALIVVLGAVGVGVYTTGGPLPPSPNNSRNAAPAADSLPTVDQHSLTTAQALVHLPTLPDERAVAEDVLRLGDKEMDLAFADAVRQLATHPPDTTPEVRKISARLHDARHELADDRTELERLTAAAARASGEERALLQGRVELAQAHLGLVQDEVDDAQEDLERAGGDPEGRMQAMMKEHEQSSKQSDTTRVNAVAIQERHGLLSHLRAWRALTQKRDLIIAAGVEAESSEVAFRQKHNALEHQDASDVHEAHHEDLSSESSAQLLLETERRALAQKTRGTLDKHVDNQRLLASDYDRWTRIVRGQARTELHAVLWGVAMILAILVAVLLSDRWFEDRIDAMSPDRRRTQTLLMASRVGIQVLGVVFSLLVVFGTPDNLGTVLGLAGAGLTVALKDPILGFFGWFVLMGTDGIGIGDLVEIKGVSGEVVELGIFHTVLLETGDWADSGHLTGRRVSFSNSFAIEGHYFNFSTNGRWLWDDVRFVVPSGRDVPGIIGKLRTQVEQLTAGSAERAERELKGSRRMPRLGALAAAPVINIKPVSGGVELSLRYLTHVRERSEVRSQLYQTAIALLGEPVGISAPPANLPGMPSVTA